MSSMKQFEHIAGNEQPTKHQLTTPRQKTNLQLSLTQQSRTNVLPSPQYVALETTLKADTENKYS